MCHIKRDILANENNIFFLTEYNIVSLDLYTQIS